MSDGTANKAVKNNSWFTSRKSFHELLQFFSWKSRLRGHTCIVRSVWLVSLPLTVLNFSCCYNIVKSYKMYEWGIEEVSIFVVEAFVKLVKKSAIFLNLLFIKHLFSIKLKPFVLNVLKQTFEPYVMVYLIISSPRLHNYLWNI